MPLAIFCASAWLLFAHAWIYAQPKSGHQLADDYTRTTFTVEDGLPDNVVNAIEQTENGLLWVGTESGLANFDGKDFTAVDLNSAGSPPQGAVHALLRSKNEDLWIGTDAGVVRLPPTAQDRFNPTQLSFYHLGRSSSDEVEALFQTRGSVIWAGTNHGLYRSDSGKFVEVIPRIAISRIAEGRNGNLLLITGEGFIEWDGHQILRHPGLAASMGVHDDQIFEVHQDSRGTMWYGTNRGVVRRSDTPFEPLLPTGVQSTATFRIFEDPRHAIWMTTGIGLYRVDGNQMNTPAPGLFARTFYLASDGDLWIGTNGYGLAHLHRRVVQMYTQADGLPNDITMSVLSAHDGKLWVGSNCGLSSFDGTRFRFYAEKQGLSNSCVWALAEDSKNNLWIGTYGGGLYQFRDGHFTQYSIEQGLASKIVFQIDVAHDDSLWIATNDGVSHLENGHIRSYTTADGLSSNRVLSVHQDHAGTIWAATQGGIDRLVDNRFIPFSSASSAEEIFAVRFLEDAPGNLFTADSPQDLSLIANSHIANLSENLKLLDMAESPDQQLWFAGNSGIIRIRRDDLLHAFAHQNEPLDYRIFNRSDGLNSIQCSVGAPNIAFGPGGKLWIATVKGLAMIDLNLLPPASRKPKAFVGSITMGQHSELAGDELVLPPGTHHVEIHLKAIDLGSPEKVRLQYRLDGVDATWLDADNSRSAVYTNIPIGPHTLHVRAIGSDGIWDRTGIAYSITQQPYFYETLWFRVLVIITCVLLIVAIYLARVQQIVQRAHIRLEERLIERERIARELHDTLLQGVLSASMQLEVAEDHIPEESPAKPLMDRVLQLMRQVVDEGRNALRGLRGQDADSGNLAVAFSRIGQEFAVGDSIRYRVASQNNPRPIHLPVRDEIYRIGREAIVNAFRHAKADSVEVSIEYASRYLRLLIRDNGRGIDTDILMTGRDGHWGLAGMRERAESIGAALKLRSRIDEGTEVELTVPGSIVFADEPVHPLSRWLPWLNGGKSNILSGNTRKRR